MWMCSGFRLNIDGIDDAKYVNKVDSFTVKQGVKKMYVGAERFPQIEPTKLDFPNLTCTISTQYGDAFHEWYQQYIAQGCARRDRCEEVRLARVPVAGSRRSCSASTSTTSACSR